MNSKPQEIWTAERLQQAALEELARHGGSQDDLRRLREHFRKAAEPENPPNPEIPEA
jgi:hypothetical protein